MKLNLSHPDDIYQALVDLYADLSETESRRMSAKLILLLANHIGDEQVIREAIATARRTTASSPAAPEDSGG